MSRTFPLIVNGHETRTERALRVLSPFDGHEVGITCLAGRAELEQAIASAQRAREPLADMPAYAKEQALRQIAHELEQRSEEFSRLLAAESAKPLRQARVEVGRAVQTFRVAAEECKRPPAEVIRLDWTESGAGKEGIVQYFPVGLVAGIAPFNFPLNLVVHKLAPAIASGCPIILKPASSTPLSSLALAEIIRQTELPVGAVTVLPMDRATGDALVTDERFALLSFTGSPEVGWPMKARAGKKRVVLELGGNAGVILSEGTDLAKALARCLMGAFAYSGQVCIHAQRFFVHRSLYEEFCERMAASATALVVGDPLDERTDISAMIDRGNTQRIAGWVDEARAAGASVLCGGAERGGIFLPTLLTDAPPTLRVCAEEAFGPVAVITPFDTFEQAVAMLNDSRFGLQAGIFTDRVSEMDYAFRHIECGGIILNDVPTFRADHMPYGGVKDSGFGREGVRYAMMDMLEPRILVKPM